MADPSKNRSFIISALEAQTPSDREKPTYRAKLTDVGAHTPTGRYLRRYWHPVALSGEATDLPRKVRALGEDLILFRAKNGRPGLLHPRCCHRGSSLFYGRVEEDGIRCCYHGWMFDAEGHCLDQPLEDGGGKFRDRVRQPWYPVKELYGLIFAYLGPPAKMPVLPRYDCFEHLPPGTQLYTDGNSLGSMQPEPVVPFNWFQHYENIHDMGHAFWLHQFHSGPQFGDAFAGLPQAALPLVTQAVNYERCDRGVLSRTVIPFPSGEIQTRIIETVLPTLRLVPGNSKGKLDHIGWVLPNDATSFRIFTVSCKPEVFAFNDEINRRRATFTPEQIQRQPADFEAQGSQGTITMHSLEHLATSDKGIVLLRRVFEEQVDLVSAGKDPINVEFDSAKQVVATAAGVWEEPGNG